MRRGHGRGIRVCIWGCVLMTLLLGTAWLLSARWTMFFMAQFGDSAALRAGTLSYLWTQEKLREKHVVQFKLPCELQWEWHRSERKIPMEWWTGFYSSSASGRQMVVVPLWMPFVLFAGAGGILLWKSRKRLPAHCCGQCGYDRRGIGKNAACPECGSQRTSFAVVLATLMRIVWRPRTLGR